MFDDDDDDRDARGRWRKGHCPNPRGRPRKKPEISEADVHHFMSRSVKATINGKETYVSRQELLLHKMFEQALKGSVTMQRKLFDRFEQSDETFAQAHLELKDIGKKVLAHYEKTGEYDDKAIEEYTEFAAMMGKDLDRPDRKQRKPRTKAKPTDQASSWRKGRPKPQWVLDQERLWAEDEAVEQAAINRAKTAAGDTEDE